MLQACFQRPCIRHHPPLTKDITLSLCDLKQLIRFILITINLSWLFKWSRHLSHLPMLCHDYFIPSQKDKTQSLQVVYYTNPNVSLLFSPMTSLKLLSSATGDLYIADPMNPSHSSAESCTNTNNLFFMEFSLLSLLFKILCWLLLFSY